MRCEQQRSKRPKTAGLLWGCRGTPPPPAGLFVAIWSDHAPLFYSGLKRSSRSPESDCGRVADHTLEAAHEVGLCSLRLSRFGIVVLIAVAFHCADYPSVAAQFSAKASNDHIDNIASAERLLPNLTQQFVACHYAAGTL